MPARDDDDELEDEFEVRVRRQRERIEKGRAERQESFWNYLGLFGVVGWSVIIPMVIGVLLGRWMDHSFGTVYRWTLGLLIMGLVIGCLNAWRIVNKDM